MRARTATITRERVAEKMSGTEKERIISGNRETVCATLVPPHRRLPGLSPSPFISRLMAVAVICFPSSFSLLSFDAFIIYLFLVIAFLFEAGEEEVDGYMEGREKRGPAGTKKAISALDSHEESPEWSVFGSSSLCRRSLMTPSKDQSLFHSLVKKQDKKKREGGSHDSRKGAGGPAEEEEDGRVMHAFDP